MTPRTQGERKRQSSKAATRIVEAIDSRSTSLRMAWAASRANTAGPAATNLALPGSASAKACRIAASTASWPAMSRPPARVLARISARSRSGANHTPSTLRTLLAPIQSRAIARKAPGGSAAPNCCTKGAAERLQTSQQTLHVVAQRRDGKGLRRGDRRQQIPMVEQDLLLGGTQQIASAIVDEDELAGAIEGVGHLATDPRQDDRAVRLRCRI